MRRVIREVDPVKPSKKLSSSDELPAIAANRHLEPNKLTRLVQGDLDWIVMKCLEKENARRYETANQLGQELQRFLANEPVQAGPPSASYRMRKFVRRNRGPVIGAGLVVLAFIGGIVGASVGWKLALDGEKRARMEEALARAESKQWEIWRQRVRDKLSVSVLTEKALSEALRIDQPDFPRGLPGRLRRDFAMADTLLTYEGVKSIMSKRLGIGENFLGTGLSFPPDSTELSPIAVREYFIPNMRDDSPHVWTRKLKPFTLDLKKSVGDLIEEETHESETNQTLRKVIISRVRAKQRVAIRFAQIDIAHYQRTLGMVERVRVLATDLADVWNMEFENALRISGYKFSGGDTVFVWIFVPKDPDEVVPATWDQIFRHYPMWMDELSERG